VPIIDMQRSMREWGRIRMGTQGDRGPRKLETFRLTSADQTAIEGAAALYGGTPRPWVAPAGPQWEVITEATELACAVPPLDYSPASQWYELWSGGGCLRRCDGATEVLTDGPCQCDPSARECQPTTRLSLILPGVPGLGLWRLESHGYYAATELLGTVHVAATYAQAGRFIPARLLATERMVKRLDSKGKPITLRFVVPALDLDLAITPGLPPAAGPPAAGDAGGQAQVNQPPLRAVPAGPPAAPVSEQVAHLGKLRPARKPPATLPATGVAVGAEESLVDTTRPGPEAEPPPPPEEVPDAGPPPEDPERLRRKIMAEARKTWPDATNEEREGLRHALGVVATYKLRKEAGQPPVSSVTGMNLRERMYLSTLLANIRHGQMTIEAGEPDADGHPTWRSWLKGTPGRVATVTQLSATEWAASVREEVPAP
jgi:Recombination directionality factor-like